MADILNFSEPLKKSPAHLHMVGNVILKFQQNVTISFWVFALTKKCDAWCLALDASWNPGGTKIPLPLRAGDKKLLQHPLIPPSPLNFFFLNGFKNMQKYFFQKSLTSSPLPQKNIFIFELVENLRVPDFFCKKFLWTPYTHHPCNSLQCEVFLTMHCYLDW